MSRRFHFALLLALAGCAAQGEGQLQPGRPAPVSDDPTTPPPTATTGTSGGDTGAPEPASSVDGPHISRSVGKSDGVVVFWPRIIPKSNDPKIRELAAQAQQRLVGLAKKVVGDRDVDVRPEPERVCPRMGCAATTLGVLLTHRGGGCTAIALVSSPGKSPAKLVSWAGAVKLKADSVPFRDYPESQVTIVDAVPCDQLIS